MSDKKIQKLLAARKHLVGKHAEYARRVDLLQCGGRLQSSEELLTKLKKRKLWCKDTIAAADLKISQLQAVSASKSTSPQEAPVTGNLRSCCGPGDSAMQTSFDQVPDLRSVAA